MADAQIIKAKIKTKENVQEAIDKIHSKINESNEKVLVLKGVRGSGRTTVLLSKETKNQAGKEINIYNRFESAGIGATIQDVGEDLIKHRLELEMTSVLLRYLISNGICDKSVEIIAEEVKKLRKLFVYDINCLGINGGFKSEIIKPGHYTEYLTKIIRSIYHPEKFSFLVDRFDWMFNRSIEAQKCIQDYFSLFDQVILTTDDNMYVSKYPTIEVNYGKNKEIVKEIIRKYIDATNGRKSIEEQLDLTNISEETIDYIIEKANGDIEIILRSIKELYFCQEKELDSSLKMKISEQARIRQKVKLPEHLCPKFYI